MSEFLTITLNPAIDLSSEAEKVHHTWKVRTVNERYDPGGGGINVARAIKELGGEAEALFVAGGETGDMLDRLLEEVGIHRHRVANSGQTRINYMVRERSSQLEYRFITRGPELQADALDRCLEVVANHAGKYVIASGSLPGEVPADSYVRLAQAAAARHARFVLDSSGAALGEILAKAPVFLFKPSLGELAALVGRELDEAGVRETACELVARGGAEFVAVTMGAEGALLASAQGVLRLPAIHVNVRSAVGAGDSFLAAMVVALSRGRTIEDAFRFGMAAGAAAVMTPGTQLCRRDDVERLYRALSA